MPRFHVERDYHGGVPERRFLAFGAVGLRWRIGCWFEPRDIWVGVFWTRCGSYTHAADIYVCLLPMLPVFVEVSWYGRVARRWAKEVAPNPARRRVR